MSTCSCSLAGTSACKYCTNNPDAISPPVVRSFTVSTSDRVLWLKTTNADRIRSKSDKELAEWLTMIERRAIEKAMSKPHYYTDEELKADWLDWLKQGVEE